LSKVVYPLGTPRSIIPLYYIVVDRSDRSVPSEYHVNHQWRPNRSGSERFNVVY